MHLKISSAKWRAICPGGDELTHWGWVTHVCVSKLTIIGSDNGLSPGRRQAIIWTSAGILLIRPLGTTLQWNVNRNSNIFIHENAFESVVCEMVSILSRPQCVNQMTWLEVAAKILGGLLLLWVLIWLFVICTQCYNMCMFFQVSTQVM